MKNLADFGRQITMPELFVALAMVLLFWITIVQPENIAPVDDPTSKDHLIYSPEILKEAAQSEPSKLMAGGKPDMAMKAASEMAQAKPHDVLSNLAAGNVIFKLGQKQEGFKLLKRSVALAPRSRFVRINYAERLAEDKQYDLAVTQYLAISEAYPRWPKPHEALAAIYLDTDRPAPAADELGKALEAEPNNGELRMQRGLALARAGQSQKGLDEFIMGDNTELASGPPPDVKQLIGYWGSLDRVIFELHKQLEDRPDDPSLKLTLGRVMMYTGQIAEAKQLFVDARKKAPSNPDIHRNLALVLQRLGDSNMALSEFMLSISLQKNKEKEVKAELQGG